MRPSRLRKILRRVYPDRLWVKHRPKIHSAQPLASPFLALTVCLDQASGLGDSGVRTRQELRMLVQRIHSV